MRTIYKYPLAPPPCHVQMPRFAKLLHVAEQHGEAYVWALVDTDAEPVVRHIAVRPTGAQVPSSEGDGHYVGTFHMAGGALVFHVFDLGEVPDA